MRFLENNRFSYVFVDLSKNQVTGRAVASACESSDRPLLITRDSVDLVAENGPERLLMNEQLIIMGSLAQLQKMLRAVYYPKMLLLSQSLVQVTEVLHKFTLSYPAKIVTLHNGQILVAVNGTVKIDIGGGNVISSVITNASIKELGLAVGKEAYAVIKASNVMVGVD